MVVMLKSFSLVLILLSFTGCFNEAKLKHLEEGKALECIKEDNNITTRGIVTNENFFHTKRYNYLVKKDFTVKYDISDCDKREVGDVIKIDTIIYAFHDNQWKKLP